MKGEMGMPARVGIAYDRGWWDDVRAYAIRPYL